MAIYAQYRLGMWEWGYVTRNKWNVLCSWNPLTAYPTIRTGDERWLIWLSPMGDIDGDVQTAKLAAPAEAEKETGQRIVSQLCHLRSVHQEKQSPLCVSKPYAKTALWHTSEEEPIAKGTRKRRDDPGLWKRSEKPVLRLIEIGSHVVMEEILPDTSAASLKNKKGRIRVKKKTRLKSYCQRRASLLKCFVWQKQDIPKNKKTVAKELSLGLPERRVSISAESNCDGIWYAATWAHEDLLAKAKTRKKIFTIKSKKRIS